MRQTKMSENLDIQNPLIEVQDLQHYYGTKLVLDVKSWQLLKNEHQLLLGPSGSGKTTLLGILTGLLSPSKGNINALGRSITDEPISKLSSFRARNIGFVFQDHHLVSSLTINENLILARHLANLSIDQKWADNLLNHLGLSDHKNAKPDQLSHGEAQRSAIARAAVTKPPLILADEPTSALDDDNAIKVVELLKSLSEEAGSTMIIASHDSRLKPFFSNSLILEKLQEALS